MYLFADNNVLIEDTRAGIKYKSKDCGEALKSKGFKLSTTKIEYLGINLVKEGKEVKNNQCRRRSHTKRPFVLSRINNT